VRQISVSLGEVCVSADPRDVLVAYGLGSCVAVSMYAPARQAAGMAHVVLPASGAGPTRKGPPGKFADTAVPYLLEQMERLGCRRRELVICLAGGAQLLNVSPTLPMMQIGQRNLEAVRAVLQQHGLRVSREDTGGTAGRTVYLYVAAGRLVVHTAGGMSREL
jgi:chemotaxis protein CheD